MIKCLIVYIGLTLLLGCEKAPITTLEENSATIIDEYSVYEIPLNKEILNPDNEISGLAWHNNDLILLPQFAIVPGDSIGYLYSINKNDIIASINSKSTEPVSSKYLKIIGNGLDEYLANGSGFEAVTFIGNSVYFSLEKSNFMETEAFIIKGIYDPIKQSIVLDSGTLAEVKSASGIRNHSEEAISIWNDKIFTIHESNGKNLVKSPRINLLDLDLNHSGYLNFPHIEYRITDITKVDSSGIFWALNYFWPGDFNEQPPAEDSLVIKYGVGKTHRKDATVERIVEMQISKAGVKLTDNAPIVLKLLENGTSRNWEGIVKLENKGFLIVTDKFPTTILGFVRYPNE